MKKVLVTGASGFIGKQLVPYLQARDYHVRILLRNPNQRHLFSQEVETHIGDLQDVPSLNGLCTNIETVFHLAGYAHANQGPGFTKHHHAINFQGTLSLLDVACAAGVRKFVYFSSVKAVGDSQEMMDENWQMRPDSPYGQAKRAAEEALLSKGGAMGISILRPALVYGPAWKGNLAAMLKAIARGRFLPLPPVHAYRSMVSVEDICQAAYLAATNHHANGKIYFVTDNLRYSSRDIYVLMMNALGKRIPAWHVPLIAFKWLAVLGDVLEMVLRKAMPFNSDKLEKLFGQALYKSERIQQELAFAPKNTLATVLPNIIAESLSMQEADLKPKRRR